MSTPTERPPHPIDPAELPGTAAIDAAMAGAGAEPSSTEEPGQPDVAAVVEAVDTAAVGVPVPARERRPRQGRRHEGRRRGPRPERQISPEQMAAERAQAIYMAARADVYTVLYDPESKRLNDEGTEQETIPLKERSYLAVVRSVQETKLGFDFDVDADAPTKKRKKKKYSRPEKKIDPTQDPDDHESARNALAALVGTRFFSDLDRLKAIGERAKTAAADGGMDAALVLNQTVRQSDRDRGAPLQERLGSMRSSLEWARVEVMRDAVDWFGQRVSQMETMMQELTIRREGSPSVAKRLEALQNHADFVAQLDQLKEDIAFFEEWNDLPVEGANADETGVIKKIIKGRIDAAKRHHAKFVQQYRELLKLGTPEERKPAEGDADAETSKALDRPALTPIEIKRNMVDAIMHGRTNPMAEKFITEAEKRLVGLSPDQEKNFWDAVLDLFEEAVPKKEEKDDGTKMSKSELREARSRRLEELNKELGLFEYRGTGAGRTGYLINIEDRTPPAEGLPKGFGQIVERCRAEAMLAAELTKSLRKTHAILGPNGKNAVKRAMYGHPNQAKIEGVERLNKLIGQKQGEAVKALKAIPVESEGMDDTAKALLAAQKKAAEDFTALLGKREPKDLKWSKKEDQPVITQIREKLYSLLELGALRQPDVEALQEILFPEVEDAADAAGAKAAKAAEDERRQAEEMKPLLRRIQEGTLPEELFTGAAETADEMKNRTGELVKRLNTALQSGVVRDAMLESLNGLKPEQLTVQSLRAFLNQFEEFTIACENYKKTFGDDWKQAIGMLLPDPSGSRKGLANKELLAKITESIKQGVDAVSAMCGNNETAAAQGLLGKVDATVRGRFASFGLSESDTLWLLLEAVPREAGQAIVPPGTALNRLANCFALQRGTERGRDLLVKLKLVENVPAAEAGSVDVVYQSNAIESIITNSAFDTAA